MDNVLHIMKQNVSLFKELQTLEGPSGYQAVDGVFASHGFEDASFREKTSMLYYIMGIAGGGGSPTQKAGSVNKCPSCGAVVESFQSRCATCDFELNSAKVANSIQAFVKKLDRASTYSEQREVIEAFPIPNTKEDIFEFAILAATKIKPEGSKTNSAWITKMKQVSLKAQLVFAEDKSSLEKFNAMLSEAEKFWK